MSHEEQHQMLCEALSKCVEILSCEELSLIAHHCGVKIGEFYGEAEVLEVIEWNERKAA